VDLVLLSEMKYLHPRVRFHGSAVDEMPGDLLLGTCNAFIMADQEFSEMQAGVHSERDCTEESPACRQHQDGSAKLQKDCDLKRVGTSLASIPVSMPARASLALQLGHRSLNLTSQSVLQKLSNGARAQNNHKSVCPTNQQSSSGLTSLAPEHLKGCFVTSAAVILLSLGLHGAEKWSKKGGQPPPVAPNEAKACVDVAAISLMLDNIGKAHADLVAKFEQEKNYYI
jgi:hypothetical protein